MNAHEADYECAKQSAKIKQNKAQKYNRANNNSFGQEQNGLLQDYTAIREILLLKNFHSR